MLIQKTLIDNSLWDLRIGVNREEGDRIVLGPSGSFTPTNGEELLIGGMVTPPFA
ncbi:MAG: hypothetical protein HN348_26735, partial [Proteobacteria bacterium]|nr:hypothetical protein [Pseudomonadota bacterium]